MSLSFKAEVHAAAKSYAARGWKPVPLRYQTKEPIGTDWQNVAADVDHAFNGELRNLGIQMGSASGGLCDVDLDVDEARAIAPYILPKTNSRFGRASARDAHWLYQTDAPTDAGAARQFRDPTDDQMLVELRLGAGAGAQTMFPPSIWTDAGDREKEAEAIKWEDDRGPTPVEFKDLLECVKRIAALSLLSRHWPRNGSKARHHTALVVGSFLARAGWNEPAIEVGMQAIMAATGDTEPKDRRRAAKDALKGFKGGKHTSGLPKLVECFGDEVAEKLAGWLDYNSGAQDRARSNQQQQKNGEPLTRAVNLETVTAADVKISAVEWLWRGRFAVGKLSLIAGLPDRGKSQIACDMTARITTTTGDKHWPCGEGIAPIGNVIVFSAEDDPSDTLVPRLMAAGADLKRVQLVKMVRTEAGERRMFDLTADLEHLRAAIATAGDVKLVIFDPLNAYFGHGRRVDTFRGNEVRAVLGPMADLAAELKVAVLGLLHFNKKTDVTNVMLRISDSLAFVAAARAVYAVVEDDENKRNLLVRGKNNLAPAASDGTLAYACGACSIGNDPDTGQEIIAPHIIWHPKHIDVSAVEAMQAAAENRSPAQIETAIGLLTDLLDGGAVEHSEIEEAAEVHKLTNATLRRAADKLEIEKAKQRRVKDGKWYWRLPNRNHPWPWEVRP
jgi:AAA domain-containing protein/bifunctional DNA primase/polymerase-like protein